MVEPTPQPAPQPSSGWGWGSFASVSAALGDVAEGAALLGSVMGVGAQCVRARRCRSSCCLWLWELDVSTCRACSNSCCVRRVVGEVAFTAMAAPDEPASFSDTVRHKNQ